LSLLSLLVVVEFAVAAAVDRRSRQNFSSSSYLQYRGQIRPSKHNIIRIVQVNLHNIIRIVQVNLPSNNAWLFCFLAFCFGFFHGGISTAVL